MAGEGAERQPLTIGIAIMERTTYDQQAEEFLSSHNLSIVMARQGGKCPPWAKAKAERGGACGVCGTTHGDYYRVTIKRVGGGSFTFSFWGSCNDNRPTDHDVLSRLGSDANCSPIYEDFCDDYGYVPASRSVERWFTRCRMHTEKICAFFSLEELDALAEIQ